MLDSGVSSGEASNSSKRTSNSIETVDSCGRSGSTRVVDNSTRVTGGESCSSRAVASSGNSGGQPLTRDNILVLVTEIIHQLFPGNAKV